MVKGKDSSVYQGLARAFNSLDIPLEVPLVAAAKKSEIEERLHFYGKARSQLENCVWVVSFDGIEGLGVDEHMVQGTAFSLKDCFLTAAHIFSKAGNSPFCYVYRVNSPQNKHIADILDIDHVSDIAKIKIRDDIGKISYLKIAPILDFKGGYKLAAVGFPQLLPGHQSVSIVPCCVTNGFAKSTFNHFNVDVDFKGGISGGPVVNMWMQVVGMAVLGSDVSVDFDNKLACIEGASAFISAEHF
jgi:hypothetical protein